MHSSLSGHADAARFAVELAAEQGTLKQLDLHGCDIQNVEYRLDQFLSDMIGLNEIGCSIVCGIGTGTMKKKVMELSQPYRKSVIETVIDKGAVLLVVFKR